MSTNNPTVMLVDDSHICNLIMQKWLDMLPSPVSIHAFINPLEAFEQLITLNPTLIFLDLNMPEIDGWEFLQRMQAANHTHRVVVLTSSTSAVDQARCNDFPNVILYRNKPVTRAFVDTIPSLLEGVPSTEHWSSESN